MSESAPLSAGEPLTAQEIAEIRQREQATTPGPWTWSRTYELYDHYSDRLRLHWCLRNPESAAKDSCIDGDLALWASYGSDWSGRPLDASPNFQFIASARSDVPRLLDTVDAQAARIAELEAWVSVCPHPPSSETSAGTTQADGCNCGFYAAIDAARVPPSDESGAQT